MIAPVPGKAKITPFKTIDFGDLSLGDAMMAWAGLYALLSHGFRPTAPGCRLYVPGELAGLTASLFAKHDIEVRGIRPFSSRPQIGPVFTSSPPGPLREWWGAFAGPDWRMNCFQALDRQKTIPLDGSPVTARDHLRLFLTERILYRRKGWRTAVAEYIGCRLWRPFALRLGVPPTQFLMLMKQSLPSLRADVARYVETTSRGRTSAPRFALFPVGKAFQAFPPALCRQICAFLPKAETAIYIQANDPWIVQYREAGLEPRPLDRVEDLFWIVKTARRVMTTDSFPSHVAQLLRDDFTLVLTRDIAENVVHPGAYPTILARHPPCAPCSYLSRADSRLCSAGHPNCLAFDDGDFASAVARAFAAPELGAQDDWRAQTALRYQASPPEMS
jgi:hypothetical protein